MPLLRIAMGFDEFIELPCSRFRVGKFCPAGMRLPKGAHAFFKVIVRLGHWRRIQGNRETGVSGKGEQERGERKGSSRRLGRAVGPRKVRGPFPPSRPFPLFASSPFPFSIVPLTRAARLFSA